MTMTAPGQVRPFRAIPISGSLLMKTLYAVEPYSIHHGEVSEAIANAANQDPLFPDREDGCLRTAAILVAIAFCTSRFNTNLVGSNGKAFGLYQIKPPPKDVNGKIITTNMLTNARDASFIAIDLIRESMFACADRPWEERLSCFGFLPTAGTDAVSIHHSMEQMLMADKILTEYLLGDGK